ncbi:hypothetical protein EB796_014984 [Bugula neritina]|uniref:Uncharacterized protein n=1 Tax=Bugula neritina TaxID=10212 RepID=A0A7J7JK32_BUGNE|nr:hypothetical protein EB796_014984 [Bugula neritina]
MVPSQSSVDYIANVSKGIMSSLRSIDPKAIWVLQGWMFSYNTTFWTTQRAKAFLTALPKGDMIVLDLAAEEKPVYPKLNSYFGQPFIFCMLNNYGGRMGLYGHVRNINQGVFIARDNSGHAMIGTGLSMEATGTNYIVYELMNEMHYKKHPVVLYDWIGNYTLRRYGFSNRDIQMAWSSLVDTAYGSISPSKEFLIARPAWNMSSLAFLRYNRSSLVQCVNYIERALVNISYIGYQSTLLRLE